MNLTRPFSHFSFQRSAVLWLSLLVGFSAGAQAQPVKNIPATPAVTSSSSSAKGASDSVPMFADVVEEVAGEDYRAVGTPQLLRLAAGERRLLTFKVPANGNYMLLAACDDECYDIDLSLFDDGGIELETDQYDDDYPVVYGDDLRAGQTIYAVLGMFDCMNEDEGCQVKLGLFAER